MCDLISFLLSTQMLYITEPILSTTVPGSHDHLLLAYTFAYTESFGLKDRVLDVHWRCDGGSGLDGGRRRSSDVLSGRLYIASAGDFPPGTFGFGVER